MSSLIRRIGRKIAMKTMSAEEIKAYKESKSQRYIDLPNGGYMVLHPTRGWRRVCGARVAAQGRLARLKGLV